MKRAALVVAWLVAFASIAYADDPKPAPDPLAVTSVSEGWLWTQSTWSPGATRRDLVGGRFQAILGVNHLGIGVRAESMGLPGSFDRNKPETFQAAAAYVAVHYNVASAPGGVQIGPAFLLGAAVPLELQNGVAPTLPSSFTFGLGVRVSSPQFWSYVAFGQHQAIRGSALLATVHVKMSDRLAWVGDFGVGRSARYVASIGVAVRAF